MFLSVVILGGFTRETHAMAHSISADTPPLLTPRQGTHPPVHPQTASVSTSDHLCESRCMAERSHTCRLGSRPHSRAFLHVLAFEALCAEELGDYGPPFHWIPERRAMLRADLDAAFLHVYGLDREEAEHVLDSFVVARKYEERDYGEYEPDGSSSKLTTAWLWQLRTAAMAGGP